MKRKEFAIVTSSDSRYGDFLVNHWLRSLTENVDLNRIDIIILDYGLSQEQQVKLKKGGAILVPCFKDGFVGSIRFRDMLKFFKKNKYQQILSVDGGDIVFQTDISSIFYEKNNTIKGALDNMKMSFVNYVCEQGAFRDKLRDEILRVLHNKKIVNSGVIFSSYKRFLSLCDEMYTLITDNKDKKLYGPDQIIFNYLLYRDGFEVLDKDFNFIILNNKLPKVKDGIMYNDDGKRISIVHNTGGMDFLRVVRNFGYGPGFNRVSKLNNFIFRLSINLNFLDLAVYFMRLGKKIGAVFKRSSKNGK